MFEKSLYDLIRGLRNHKGNEKEYIQNSLKECRAEIRGKDMDIKATALLKLIYLEMFGHDMSWAAFHVLEVMSSAKYLQKRVGYLGAVQSFRPDTEVLMLATNLLKKDLVTSSLTTMSLPIITLPHIITPSLAMSVLSDLLPRLTHSSPAVRKKTIVTLYRLALCYPETLRPAWPKIKERLMDDNEDSSVTAAIVNVVCELGWRRPQDFLPLAPRLFELLIDSGNNWMAIKLIKLFATLTPLEQRLIKKLLPPLTSIIRTTPAMSLLYECINGIIEGGILANADDSIGGEEIATLCVSKLRGMIMVEGDPNLKYVALLAFNKIVITHPYLVAQQEDVIMDCLDSTDISIRLRALDLVVGMVSSDNLISITGRLMRQLRNTGTLSNDQRMDPAGTMGQDPMTDSESESPEANIKTKRKRSDVSPPLPDEYRINVIGRIIEMCAAKNYGNLLDFDWYIDVLIQLVRNSPLLKPACFAGIESSSGGVTDLDISEKVGDELRNIAVKVRAVRAPASRAAESIILSTYNGSLPQGSKGQGALRPIAWVAGEYASHLTSPEDVLTALLHISSVSSNSEHVAVYLQAITKIFALLAGDDHVSWTSERKTMVSLLMARVIHILEPFATHPDLEVQERAVEFAELLRLAAEASVGQEAASDGEQQDTPLLLTQAIPSLFGGLQLNSVAFGAQRNVPLPSTLDLDKPVNNRLVELLQGVDSLEFEGTDYDDFEAYYHQQPPAKITDPVIYQLPTQNDNTVISYQHGSAGAYLDPDIVARRRAERRERNKDDPYYIAGTDPSSDRSTPLDSIIQIGNEIDVDIDSIPIMQLDLGQNISVAPEATRSSKQDRSKARQLILVAADETLFTSGTSTPGNDDSEPGLEGTTRTRPAKSKNSLLLVDSSGLGTFSLEGHSGNDLELDRERQQQEDAEMAKAMQEVEKLRLEMQRANERIQAAQGIPPEGTLVKKKTRRKKQVLAGDDEHAMAKKKKAKKPAGNVDSPEVGSNVKRNKAARKIKIQGDGVDKNPD